MNIRITIPKNLEISGMRSVFVRDIMAGNDRVSAAAAHDGTSRRRLQTLVRLP
jgi:hypothetical protein